MRHLIIAIIAPILVLVGGCSEQAGSLPQAADPNVTVDDDEIIIRSISFTGTKDDYEIELRGTRGILHQEGRGDLPVPADDVSALIDGFYQIPGISSYRGKESDNRQSELQHLILLYDEADGRPYKDWADYVIPKDSVESGSPLMDWLDAMGALRDRINSEQD